MNGALVTTTTKATVLVFEKVIPDKLNYYFQCDQYLACLQTLTRSAWSCRADEMPYNMVFLNDFDFNLQGSCPNHLIPFGYSGE